MVNDWDVYIADSNSEPLTDAQLGILDSITDSRVARMLLRKRSRTVPARFFRQVQRQYAAWEEDRFGHKLMDFTNKGFTARVRRQQARRDKQLARQLRSLKNYGQVTLQDFLTWTHASPRPPQPRLMTAMLYFEMPEAHLRAYHRADISWLRDMKDDLATMLQNTLATRLDHQAYLQDGSNDPATDTEEYEA